MNDALVLLALIWVAFLIPSALRSRSASPHATVGGFARAMDVLRNGSRTGIGRDAAGRRVLVPSDPGRIVDRAVGRGEPADRDDEGQGEDPQLVRRRSWFIRAVLAAAATVTLAIAFGGWLWLPAGASIVVTAAYTAVLRRLKLQRDEARRVVRDLELPVSRRAVTDGEQVAVSGGAEPDPAGQLWSESSTVRLRRWDD